MMMMLVACLGRNVRMERMMIEEAAACYVSVVGKAAARFRSLQHVGGSSAAHRVVRKASRSTLASFNIDGFFHVMMMSAMMITISEPVTSRRR